MKVNIKFETLLSRFAAVFFLLLLASCSRYETYNATLIPTHAKNKVSEQIICIHGFGSAKGRMIPLAKKLRKSGQVVRVWGYPSRQKSIQDHAEDLVDYLNTLAKINPSVRISFVTHSLGGILLRAAVNHPHCPQQAKGGRAILIAPPSRGCEFGRQAGEWSIVQSALGKNAGRELIENDALEFDFLGNFPPTMEVLIIAGVSGMNPAINEANDGIVRVKETLLNTPHELAIVEADHVTILYRREVAQIATRFFAQGAS